MNSCSPTAASLPGSAPHRDVTTCKAASQVSAPVVLAVGDG
jgi:hypothetical protein